MNYLQTAFSEAELSRWAFCGSSAGSMYALGLALGVPAAEMRELMMQMAADCRPRKLGIVGYGAEIIEPYFRQLFCQRQSEAEAVERIRGRFAVSFSAVHNGTLVPHRAQDFETASEVWEAMTGSGNIPPFSNVGALWKLPRVGGLLALDGAFTTEASLPMLPCRTPVYAMAIGHKFPDATLVRRVGSPTLAPFAGR
jgi:hypothetical protein